MKNRRISSIHEELVNFPSFKDGCRTINRFHRLLGYSFISYEDRQGYSKVQASVRSPYLLFAICSWSVYQFFLIHDCYNVLFLSEEQDGSPLRLLDKCILFFYLFRCIGIQLVNATTMVQHSKALTEVIENLNYLESTFRRDTKLRSAAKLILLQNAVFSVLALISVLQEVSGLDGYMSSIYVKVIYALCSFIFTETVSMVCFLWVMFFCKVFEAFIRCVNEDIDSLTFEKQVRPEDIQEQHRRFSQIWNAFVQCNTIFSVSLVISIPLNIMNASPWGYYILSSDGDVLGALGDTIGFATMCMELLVLGVYGKSAQVQVRTNLLLLFSGT